MGTHSATLLTASVFLMLAFAGTTEAQVRMARGITFQGLDAPRELALDGRLDVVVHLEVSRPLDRELRLFVHAAPPPADEGRPCRLVANLELGREPSGGARDVEVRADLGEVARCGVGPLDVHVGLFEVDSGQRVAVLDGAGDHDRIHAARVSILAEGSVVDGSVVLHTPPLEHPEPPPLVLPASVQAVLALLIAMAVLVLVSWRTRLPLFRLDVAEDLRSPRARQALLLAPMAIFVPGVLACLGWVKDDAYISFRYANNLVNGRGMVFNAGERVEGYTNFLWTLLMAPFEWLGADLVQVTDVLGPVLGAVLLVLVVHASRRIDGPGPGLSHLWGAMWLASSSSFTLWCVGGLEQSLAMLLPFAGAFLTWHGWRGADRRTVAAGGLALAGACLTRPEGHLFVILVGLVLLVEAVRRDGAWRLFLAWATPLAVLLGPYHVWRVLYFGALLPNTYLVKAVTGREVLRAGLHLLDAMLRFNSTGVVIGLAVLSLALRGSRVARGLMVVVAVCFMAYVAKIGSDELIWHRLFLPALPFVVVAAAEGLRLLTDGLSLLTARRLRWVPCAVGWIVVLAGCWTNLAFTFREMAGNAGYAGCSGTNHPDLGKFLTRHSRPGELVAFQDMGATPYHAPDLRFLDLVGLVDRNVALLLQRHGIHPFVGSTRARSGGAFCEDFRDYVFERRPEWVVLVPWPSRGQVDDVARRFFTEDPEEVLRRSGSFRNTQFDCLLYSDPRFRARYVHVRTWQRSAVYYLSTFMRRDLWERTPSEVVLAEAPGDLPGPRASFDNGVELLGGRVERDVVVERHEVFVTTWWRVPGRRSRDLLIFVHLDRRGQPASRTSLDHPAGDWLYPADRWRPGQVIEDRVLVQLPVGLVPGTYDVRVGMFDRRTGDRVGFGEGEGGGDRRIDLGHLEVRPMRNALDSLIPRTDPVEQRHRMPRAAADTPGDAP